MSTLSNYNKKYEAYAKDNDKYQLSFGEYVILMNLHDINNNLLNQKLKINDLSSRLSEINVSLISNQSVVEAKSNGRAGSSLSSSEPSE